VASKLKKMGWLCSDTAELAFEDVRVGVALESEVTRQRDRGDSRRRRAHRSDSITVALAWPPASHMVCSP
jgi:hypothetical protein